MAAIPAAAKRLLDFIRGYEAPRGYDTVFGNRMAQMPKPITAMTVDEVIADGPRRTRQFGSSAAGAMQFMTATLKGLKTEMRLTGREVMTPAFQDVLGYQLLKRRGFPGFMAGTINLADFGLALAKEWASFPVLVATRGAHRGVARGQSYYAGDGLNKALVSADAVVAALRGLRADVEVAALPTPETAIALPRVTTVSAPPPVRPSLWQVVFGGKAITPAEPKPRPGLKPTGSPDLWDTQDRLRSLGYYTKGFLDGLDGPLTQEAVAQARKDNGLGDGPVDAAFLAALPTMPRRPVSAERANLPIAQAIAARPDLFGPVKWLVGAGLSLGVGGAADGAGVLDNVQAAANRVGDVAGSVQSAFGVVAGSIGFLVEHRALVLIALGLFLVWKAVGHALDMVAKIRAAFL